MQDLIEKLFGQKRNPPQAGCSQLQTQIVETEFRAAKAFWRTIIISFKKCEAMRLLRDNFLLSLVVDGKYITRDRKIPDLMFKSLGWFDDVKVLVLQSPVKLAPGSALQLIGHIKGSSTHWVREIKVV